MSMIQITGTTRMPSGSVLVQMTSGKRSMFVTVWGDGMLHCCVMNAAARRTRGYGRTYRTLAEALAAYKSSDVHAMLNCAVEVAAHA